MTYLKIVPCSLVPMALVRVLAEIRRLVIACEGHSFPFVEAIPVSDQSPRRLLFRSLFL